MAKTIIAEVPEETACFLKEVEKETGKSLTILVAVAFTLLKYAIEGELSRIDAQGNEVKLFI